MTIDKKSINKKLNKLTESLEYLEKYRKETKEDFLVDFTVNAAAMHYMVLGIEIITDIGNHILNENYQVSSDEYSEVIEKLGEYEIVPEKFAKENADMAKFRNLIIHAYDKIDMEQVYQNLQKTPDIFRKFAKYFVEFLEKN
ncbi:DUF86 domain-containing protein [Patescibacteria group bacterium]|nr:DUF86 domain-containing protein [Patescibacteria group bacterium]MBU4579885.1 DUF86 domain-containing protein [Patescibacteria group bacterium]